MDIKHGEHHIIDYSLFIFIWLSLIIFTGLTVIVAGMNFAVLTIFIALFIASVKTTLVLYYFMHLKFETKLFKITLIVSIITAAIFIVFTFSDTLWRY